MTGVIEPWLLPRDWEWREFRDVAKIASNLVDPKKWSNEPHIAPNHIESEMGRLLPHSTIADDEVTSPKHRFHAGQLLYSKIRPYLAKVAYVDFAGLCSADMYPIEALIEPRYLQWWMLTREFTRLAANQQARTVLPKINQSALNRLPVPVAPPAEQRRIVEIVEDHLSHLDTADASLQAAAHRGRALTSSALHTWMTGPSERLGELTLRSGYGTSTKCAVDGLGDPVARIPNIVQGHLDMSDAKCVVDPAVDVSALYLKEGDLLIVRTNGSRDLIGRCAVVGEDRPIAFASYLIRYQFDTDRLHPDWARLVLTAPAARAQIELAAASSAGQYNLSVTKLNSIVIPCPSIHEQSRALQHIHAFESEVRRLETPLHHGLLRSTALRRAVLAAAFSGRLTGASSDSEIIEEMAQA